ncbi:MAG: DNA-directed RNA polymerase subunit omega [Acidobacteria bacterium]|nr:MAG: DNA-directed RNA polymerase subunit omega [Acidobacteriota bacterium]
MIIKVPPEFDSKFRFILVAAERAKQIQNGAPPKIDVKSAKPAFIALREVEQNLIGYEILEEAIEEEEIIEDVEGQP